MRIPPPRRWLPSAVLAMLLAACGAREADYYPGYVEADYVRLASPFAGTLAHLYVQRGDHVAPGAPAFVLEQDSERDARAEAATRLARAKAMLADLEKGRRPDEIAAARAAVAQAEASLRLSRSALARANALQAAHFVSPAQIDEARAAVRRDEELVRALQAQVRVARLAARPDQLAAARQDVAGAEAQLAQADWALSKKSLKAPLEASVADVLYREGELVPAGMPVVSLLAPDYLRARFFVPEARLGTLRLGQGVTLACDGCGAPIPATISFIAREAEYTAPLIYSKETRATLVFMVEARPAPGAARGLNPGQPLEVRPGAR